jgi:hypothetical protein
MEENIFPKRKRTSYLWTWLTGNSTAIGTFVLGWMVVIFPISISQEVWSFFDSNVSNSEMPWINLTLFSFSGFVISYILVLFGFLALITPAHQKRGKTALQAFSVFLFLILISYLLSLWALSAFVRLDISFEPLNPVGKFFLFIWTVGTLSGISLQSFRGVHGSWFRKRIDRLGKSD